MQAKTIKIRGETYNWLLKLVSDAQKKADRRVTFDDVLNGLKESKMKKKKDIMSLAGSWKMSDEEAKKIITEIYKERKVISRRL